MVDYLGWAATAVFVGSYFCTRAETLKRVQMVGALMWVMYGVMMNAMPVIASNVLVIAVAGLTAMRTRRTLSSPAASPSAS
jgi:hypothetical protein